MPLEADIYGLYSPDLRSLCSFSIEEELLCEAQCCIGTLCQRLKIFTFQLTAHIKFLKERDSVKSSKIVPGKQK